MGWVAHLARARLRRMATARFCVHRTFIPLIVAAASFAGAASSRADQSIGGAEIVINEVTGALASGSTVTVIQGDSVYRDELVRTNTVSKARFVLLDSTNLTIGPSSTIKLDRFVYAGAERPGAIAARAAAARAAAARAADSAVLGEHVSGKLPQLILVLAKRFGEGEGCGGSPPSLLRSVGDSSKDAVA